MKIDLTKTYKTQSGNEVILHEIKLQNSCGNDVSYPVKGSIVFITPKERKKMKYNIWSLDGEYDLLNKNHKYNLVCVD